MSNTDHHGLWNDDVDSHHYEGARERYQAAVLEAPERIAGLVLLAPAISGDPEPAHVLPRHGRTRARRDRTRQAKRAAVNEIPAGWPATGRVEFVRFIRSDHKLRLLGRAVRIPDGHAYQYLTATLDLSIAPAHDNLLVCDEQGELITTTRLNSPRR